MRYRRLMLMLADAVLIASSVAAVFVIIAVAKERRDDKRIDDVKTLLGVVAPPERKN